MKAWAIISVTICAIGPMRERCSEFFMKTVVATLSALAEPTRLAALAILWDEHCVCELMTKLGATKSKCRWRRRAEGRWPRHRAAGCAMDAIPPRSDASTVDRGDHRRHRACASSRREESGMSANASSNLRTPPREQPILWVRQRWPSSHCGSPSLLAIAGVLRLGGGHRCAHPKDGLLSGWGPKIGRSVRAHAAFFPS